MSFRHFLLLTGAVTAAAQPVFAQAGEQSANPVVPLVSLEAGNAEPVPDQTQAPEAVAGSDVQPANSPDQVNAVQQPLGSVAGDESLAADPRVPLLFEPQDDLERGLWMQVEEAERDIRTSRQVIRDEALNTYMRNLLCKVAGDAECANVRIYIMRNPNFNASMAPNGAMQIWSGLILRTQNEAQLAAVLAHEYAHFRNRHSVALFREASQKADTASWLSFTGIGLIASFAIIGSIFKYSREMEQEADIAAVAMLADAGYDTREASVIWEQLRDEMDATAAARGKKSRKDKDGGIFATHPPSAERVTYLRAEAQSIPGTAGVTGNEDYQRAMAQWLPVFLDDQLKMNDFGASSFLLDSITKSSGSTAWIEYARGELLRRQGDSQDLERAVGHYDNALAFGDVLPEVRRGRGLALMRLGNQAEGRADLREYLAQAPDAADRGMITIITGVNE